MRRDCYFSGAGSPWLNFPSVLMAECCYVLFFCDCLKNLFAPKMSSYLISLAHSAFLNPFFFTFMSSNALCCQFGSAFNDCQCKYMSVLPDIMLCDAFSALYASIVDSFLPLLDISPEMPVMIIFIHHQVVEKKRKNNNNNLTKLNYYNIHSIQSVISVAQTWTWVGSIHVLDWVGLGWVYLRTWYFL